MTKQKKNSILWILTILLIVIYCSCSEKNIKVHVLPLESMDLESYINNIRDIDYYHFINDWKYITKHPHSIKSIVDSIDIIYPLCEEYLAIRYLDNKLYIIGGISQFNYSNKQYLRLFYSLDISNYIQIEGHPSFIRAYSEGITEQEEKILSLNISNLKKLTKYKIVEALVDKYELVPVPDSLGNYEE